MIFDLLQPVLDVVHSTSYRALSISRRKIYPGFVAKICLVIVRRVLFTREMCVESCYSVGSVKLRIDIDCSSISTERIGTTSIHNKVK